jgi:hypothetical protein
MTFSYTDPLLSRCCEVVAAPRQTPGLSRGFDLIPKLVVPPEVAISSRPGAMPTGIGSGSGDTYTSSIEVEGLDSMEGLVAGLADQIRDQGWLADAQWSGTLSAGSTWTRTLDDGTELAGKLSAQSIGSGYHDLTFMLVLLN